MGSFSFLGVPPKQLPADSISVKYSGKIYKTQSKINKERKQNDKIDYRVYIALHSVYKEALNIFK